jgi:MFS family permease
VATIVTAECKEFWQLLLCQGFLTGLSCGMIFGPIPTILSHWFNKRRSFAFGISAAGSALGGTVIPIASSHFIELIGYVKAQRGSHNTANKSFQVQMDHASYHPDHCTYAHDRKPGEDLCVRSVGIIASRVFPPDLEAKVRSSKNHWSLLCLGRFSKARLKRIHHRRRYQFPRSLHALVPFLPY